MIFIVVIHPSLDSYAYDICTINMLVNFVCLFAQLSVRYEYSGGIYARYFRSMVNYVYFMFVYPFYIRIMVLYSSIYELNIKLSGILADRSF